MERSWLGLRRLAEARMSESVQVFGRRQDVLSAR
jgi:hypothetical protein